MTNHTNPTNADLPFGTPISINPLSRVALTYSTMEELQALAADPANCFCDPDLEGSDCDLHTILNRRLARGW